MCPVVVSYVRSTGLLQQPNSTFFLVQLELVKKNLHEVNKIPKHYSGTLYLQPIQSDSYILILTSKDFFGGIFSR